MSDPTPYRVRGKRTSCRVTYNCRTPELALATLRDFLHGEYTEVECIGPDGQSVSLDDLVTMMAGEPAGGAPVDVGALASPRLLTLA